MHNYLEAITDVIHQLKLPDSPCKDIDVHKSCYMGLFKHLLENDVPFSMEAALNWLESRKTVLSSSTYSSYRSVLFRLEHYLLFGDVNSPFCRSEDCFFCRSGMSESFFRLTYELEEYYHVEQNPSYYHTYSVAIKGYFKVATDMGITEPEAITIDSLLVYWDTYCQKLKSTSRRQNAVCAMTALMKYLNKRGDVPSCYQLVLCNGNAERLKDMKLPNPCEVFHPSSVLEPKAEEYLASLGDWKYKESSLDIYRNDFSWYFMFLELNHMSHSSTTVKLWNSVLPDYPNQKKSNCSVKAHRYHTIQLFDYYLRGCLESNYLAKCTMPTESLPEWSRCILADFIESRKRDGMAESTLVMCRSAGFRFFQYLAKGGISSPAEITPNVVKSFHNQDEHSTPESKNAYSIKLRQLLNYMADIHLVPATLAYAVSTSCAPRRIIVDVLNDDMIDKIYDYREKASSPLELRDTAIVMLGLRMGIRGIDILNLQIRDFDWKNKTVSFVQRKTRKAITLPVPTDVGNSVYKYITCGRPKSADAGNGYVFIRHQAPCIPFSDGSITCKSSLKRILGAYGIELKQGQGFHMTRKTFATRMLRADNRLDSISNALGHARQATAEVYLDLDEKSMRLCPLEFGGVL